MEKKNKPIVSILLLLAWMSFSGCQLFDISPSNNGKVEIYLLKSWQTKPNSLQILENDIEMEAEPFITYSDIIQYDPNEHTFKLMKAARERVFNQENFGHSRAFAVTVNDSIIYTGYFWASFSSMICDWVVIDPLIMDITSLLSVRLGYPGFLPEFNIPDKRNDPQIIKIFEADKKLKN